MVKEWLEKACCMDCYPAAEEAALREANGGQLPETAFLCPEVREPADLAKYNGFYDYESLGMFNLFLTPVYDTESARQFRASMNKEFGIDQEYSCLLYTSCPAAAGPSSPWSIPAREAPLSARPGILPGV